MENHHAATEFLKKVLSDEALKTRVADPSQAVAVAAELGYEITEEELISAEKELRKQENAEVVELNEENMDQAAGGLFGFGEDAKDGHEKGCLFFYHHYEYVRDNKEWCEYEFHTH
ncbi:MAG: Nif11-like leader peptide family natural product precursor [Clostridia bacterium]|nr:Nif11-like leader peptide family natural product precursor [Clostridia bacterium]